MKIVLLNTLGKANEKKVVVKNYAGGFGTGFWVGDSKRAKFIEESKKSFLKILDVSLVYVATILKKAGHDVSYVENQIVECDFVIIKSSIVDYKTELEFAKRYKKETNAIVVFVGVFAAQQSKLYLEHADFVIKGEAEKTIVEIVNGKKRKGLIYSPVIKDLDFLPFPDWSIFPIKDYKYKILTKKRPVLPVQASRGCCYSCNYCPYIVEFCWRKRSPEKVLDEIECNKERFDVKAILFRDPLFAADKKQGIAIAEGLIKRKIDLNWCCEIRLDTLDIKLIDLFYEAGLKHIHTGIESSNFSILKSIGRKPIAFKHQEKIIEYCNSKGIGVSGFFILGLPGDTVETVRQTIEYSKSLGLTTASFNICTPYPGTKFYESVKNDIDSDWQDFDGYTPVFKHKNISKKQLLKLKEEAYCEFYFRPKVIYNFFKRNFL